jgi:hypothetical protein
VAEGPWIPAFGFEQADAWSTAPDLLDRFDEKDLWCSRTIGFEALANGLTLDSGTVKQGNTSGLWRDHPRFPTLHTRSVPSDWRGARALSLWIDSDVATNEVIVAAVLADNPDTPWRDFHVFPFRVNWTGWRQVVMPLKRFERLGDPAGWSQIQGVYFFTKIFDLQPHPATVVRLDSMALERRVGFNRAMRRLPVASLSEQKWVSRVPPFVPERLNHSFPEVSEAPPGDAPIKYEPYFRTERAMFGYFPRFQPGPISFDTDGNAYLQYGSTVIETRSETGTWSAQDIAESVLLPYAKRELGFKKLQVNNGGQTNETAIRFDTDGDAYMLCFVSDPTGNWRTRHGLLLHSRDGMQTWTVYQLPTYMVRFEKNVGHNSECLQRPPVLLLSKYHAPTTISITIPEKQADGTLQIPPPVNIATDALPFIPHSGEANQAVTHGDKVFLVYGRMTVLPGKTVEDGVPAFARTFDINTRELSEPVLIGFGGKNAKDNHNWPALATDSTGILHVVINGHHDPFRYTHSLKPYDISEWAPTETVSNGVTYAGLICDDRDTLYTVTRMSHPGYAFRLSLHRKKAGQDWEEARHLVIPFKRYYKVWNHKLTIDPATQRLFLFYWSQSPSNCLFLDEYLAYIDIWPHREKPFLEGRKPPLLPVGTAMKKPRKYEFYRSRPSEPVLLMSDDRGETWRFALSEDL